MMMMMMMMMMIMHRSCRQWLRHIEQQFVVMATDWLSQSTVAAGSFSAFHHHRFLTEQTRHLLAE